MQALTFIRKLGEGGFGKVMLYFDRLHKEEVAVKFIKTSDGKRAEGAGSLTSLVQEKQTVLTKCTRRRRRCVA